MLDDLEQTRFPLPDNLKKLVEDRQRLCETFSLDNFQLVGTPEDQPFVRITLPEPVTQGQNPFTEEIEHSRFTKRFPGGISEAASHLDQSIRDHASAHDLPEIDEIAIRNDPAVAEAIEKGFQHEGEVTTPEQEYDRQRLWMQIFFAAALRTAFNKIKPKVGDTPEFHAWMRKPAARVIEQRVDRIRQLIGHPSKPETARFVVVDSKGTEVFKTPQNLIIGDRLS